MIDMWFDLGGFDAELSDIKTDIAVVLLCDTVYSLKNVRLFLSQCTTGRYSVNHYICYDLIQSHD